jgi:hypothetical protein
MSDTLLRLGLWIFVLVLAVYVVAQTNETVPIAQLVPLDTLEKAMGLGVLLVLAGVVMKILEKGAKAVAKNRCAVCRTPIAHGAIYCREHLRTVLHREDDRTHMTRIRR